MRLCHMMSYTCAVCVSLRVCVCRRVCVPVSVCSKYAKVIYEVCCTSASELVWSLLKFSPNWKSKVLVTNCVKSFAMWVKLKASFKLPNCLKITKQQLQQLHKQSVNENAFGKAREVFLQVATRNIFSLCCNLSSLDAQRNSISLAVDFITRNQ